MVAPDVDSRDKVIEAVAKAFTGAVLKTPPKSLTLSLTWQIPRSESHQWSKLFRDVQTLASSLGVVDYCVTQSSFEEVFLQLAQASSPSGKEENP
ncbi:hypothetical protein GCK32_002792 [Trichostrongylus colubriformis]|uniref:Uncharacterized protein n=1 Tax=Trichostrongylus colubriformis TaxID=6319 RepID=A0AAN8IVN4_TRICO